MQATVVSSEITASSVANNSVVAALGTCLYYVSYTSTSTLTECCEAIYPALYSGQRAKFFYMSDPQKYFCMEAIIQMAKVYYDVINTYKIPGVSVTYISMAGEFARFEKETHPPEAISRLLEIDLARIAKATLKACPKLSADRVHSTCARFATLYQDHIRFYPRHFPLIVERVARLSENAGYKGRWPVLNVRISSKEVTVNPGAFWPGFVPTASSYRTDNLEKPSPTLSAKSAPTSIPAPYSNKTASSETPSPVLSAKSSVPGTPSSDPAPDSPMPSILFLDPPAAAGSGARSGLTPK